MQRFLKLASLGALLLALAALPAAWLLSTQARSVQYIVPVDEPLVAANRFLYEDEPTGDVADIVAIYGTPSGEPEEVLFVDDAEILHPLERPELALLPKAADENPLQVQSVWLVARFTALGALAAAVAGLLALLYLRRRKGTAAGGSPVHA